MKRLTIIISLILGISAVSSAQPRAAGIRIGATGLDASYQHSLNRNIFLQGDMGLDFGSGTDAGAGFKAAATYNIVWARPAWTDHGTWALYAGPGLALGYTGDNVTYRAGDLKFKTKNHGFMLGIALQAGLEYNFEFPLQLSVDLRPYFGFHIAEGIDMASEVSYSPKTGFYNHGILGFIPTLSARYCF
jgi:hypothetical protein